MTDDGTLDRTLTALAPSPDPLDPAWVQATLADIRSTTRAAAPRPRRGRRRTAVGVTAAVLTLGSATAVAVGGPGDAIKALIEDFGDQPNTSGNGMGELSDPLVVAEIDVTSAVITVWIATSSTGKVCYAMSRGNGTLDQDELDYGCGGQIVDTDGTSVTEMTRPDQLGGYFKDSDGPLVYGIAPYADAVTVRVRGTGVDRTLPIRPDSHGYGATLPGASRARAVTLTFLAADGAVLGTKRIVAPVG